MLLDSAVLESRHSHSATLPWILVVLVVSLALSGFQVLSTYQQSRLSSARAASHSERVKAAEDLVNRQQSVITSLMDTCQKAAYGSAGVDRISEQQLLAAESAPAAPQVIALQNSQIIQLLATVP